MTITDDINRLQTRRDQLAGLQKMANEKLNEARENFRLAGAAVTKVEREISSLQNYQFEEMKKVQRRNNDRDRRNARKIADQYRVRIEDDSDRDRHFAKWISKPSWLEGDDPLIDGHFANSWSDVLWIVEFYAKHHPEHPDHANRESGIASPHC